MPTVPLRVPLSGSQPDTASTPGLAELLLLLPVIAILVVWGARDGGYDPSDWLPGALFALGVVVVLVVVLPPGFWRSRAPAAAMALFLAFTLWCYASISWAGVRGTAWDGANRTLLYALVFAIFAWRPIATRFGFALLAAYAVAIAVVGSVALARAGHIEGAFISGRFAAPISYPNANAALFLIAGMPAVVIASRRGVHPLGRAALLASAGVLAELALLCQSRASLVAVPLTLLVTFVLAPRRVAFLLVLGIVTLPVLLSTHRLLAVYPAVVAEHGVAPRLHDARVAVAWTAGALFACGLVLGLLDRRLAVPPRLIRAVQAALVVLAVCGIGVGATVFARRYGSPAHEISVAWRHFKAGDSETVAKPTLSTHLLSGVASQRYDLWRVALHEFVGAPVRGVGVDNYAADYLRLRRTRDEPLYPHSLELRLLAQTGLVGTLLFAGFLAAAFAAVSGAYRRGRSSDRALIAACLGAFAYWFLHGSVDWLWEFPGLAAPAIAWLALATRLGQLPQSGEVTRRRYAVLAPALAAAASLGLPWVAVHEIDAAAAGWRADPGQAFRRLDLAARLNPLDDDAQLVAGVVATRLDQDARAADYFRAALARDPTGWFAHLELAALASKAGHRDAALRELDLARSLDPREVAITNTIDEVRRGHDVSPEKIESLFAARTAVLTGAKQR